LKLDSSAFVADPELIASLEGESTNIVCNAERLLFRQGEEAIGLYLLKSGDVTLSMVSTRGDEVLSVKAKPGSLLGLPGVIANEPYTLTAVAHTDAELSYITREKFVALMESSAMLSLKVLQVLAAEVRSARNAILT